MSTTSRIFAHVVSVVFHPLAIIPYVFGFLVYSNASLFGFTSERMEGVVVISVISTSAMFPVLSITLMKALGLVQSFQLHTSKERIGPLIATGLFFLWLYVNVRANDSIPPAFSFFVLGSTIAVFLALVVNSFTKISLHAIGAGGMLAGMTCIVLSFSYGYTQVLVPFTAISFYLSDRALLGIICILAGAIGTARLILHAHRPDEIYGGYLVGILSQLVAIRIFF